MILTRRSFLTGLIAAPLIVKSASIMKVRALPLDLSNIIMPMLPMDPSMWPSTTSKFSWQEISSPSISVNVHDDAFMQRFNEFNETEYRPVVQW